MEDYGKCKESDLLRLIGRRDNGAMKALYDRYVEYLSAVCARYIVDEDDRKDVLQECFIRIFTSLDRFEFRGEGSLKAWMIRIAVNESLRFLKKSTSNNFIEYDGELPDVAEEPEVEGIPDAVVNDMILSLPPGYRMVFNLYVFGINFFEYVNKLGKTHFNLFGLKLFYKSKEDFVCLPIQISGICRFPKDIVPTVIKLLWYFFYI